MCEVGVHQRYHFNLHDPVVPAECAYSPSAPSFTENTPVFGKNVYITVLLNFFISSES